MIRSLHHMAFRCRNSEETRAFYEDVIGLPLAAALELGTTKTGRAVRALHTFFRLHDGSFIAFFEVPDSPFEFKEQHDFDLHIALEADEAGVTRAIEAARARGLDVRGPSDHEFIRSVYFRDPSGYVVELAVKQPAHDEMVDPARNNARAILARWTQESTRPAALAG
jgi:catechol 2,3-dioxygenase-like lactoylglutathione lyase family enzyme